MQLSQPHATPTPLATAPTQRRGPRPRGSGRVGNPLAFHVKGQDGVAAGGALVAVGGAHGPDGVALGHQAERLLGARDGAAQAWPAEEDARLLCVRACVCGGVVVVVVVVVFDVVLSAVVALGGWYDGGGAKAKWWR